MTIETTLVRDVLKQFKGSADVFRRYKIDYYRIGDLPLCAAAARQNCDLGVLAGDIESLPKNAETVPTETRYLIAFIDRHYRAFHNRFAQAVLMAHRLDVSEGGPRGVSRLLKVMAQDLLDHRQRETVLMSSAERSRPNQRLRFPVLRMIMEHDDMSDQLDTLAALLNDYSAPVGADHEIIALYHACQTLDAELRFHMHLENNLLFPRFIGSRRMAN